MSRSNDAGHFFQTSSALSEQARRAEKTKNTLGDPIRLKSKLLAIEADPSDDDGVYVAEAAGNVRRIQLETNTVTHTFTGPGAPLSSVTVSLKARMLFAGCWDKTIWAWPLPSRSSTAAAAAIRGTPRFSTGGHSDFVKCLLALSLGGRDLLVSGGADARIVVWDVETAMVLYALTGHNRAVLALALDPASHSTRLARRPPAITVLSAGSDREVRAWRIRPDKGHQVAVGGIVDDDDEEKEGTAVASIPPLIAHDTSVEALVFDAVDDLWTASADRSAKCLARGPGGFHVDTCLLHPDFVRAVVVDDINGWVITACRDERVRVWDKSSAECMLALDGHYDEVTALCISPRRQCVVSVSIDGTVRRWRLKRADVLMARQEGVAAKANGERDASADKRVDGGKETLLTDEEEEALTELVGDGD